ncbi:putative cyclin-D7-1 [Jatropha curcas]|uniref:putative cyclin-D7-1 n=1 Tax=Jatropha curcas TaxID=180498 RepID=UPI0018950334|nr:putative cyclin-D7-1 [Jatropha curcas]
MDTFLLCDEAWLSTPPPTPGYCNNVESYSSSSLYTSKEECEQAFSIYFEKELTYMPQQGYLEHLHFKNLFSARFRAIQWLIKSRSRLDLSFITLFNAVNYFDRFVSINQCKGWRHWMVELLSVACLSVATKFTETFTPTLYEIQMEELDHSFESITIQRMELMLLKALGWRLCSTTAYSYVELLMMNIEVPLKPHLQKDFVDRVNQLLLEAILDCKLMEYQPSIVAVSAVWCGLEELLPSKSDTQIAYIKGFFDQNRKNEIIKCHKIMEEKMANGNLLNYCPSSPVTVLLTEEKIDVYDTQIDLSLFQVSNTDTESSNKRRKREVS